MACSCVVTLSVSLLVLLIFVKIYLKLTTRWCRSQTCLVGKTVIVTGANTGIGFETALDFAKRGARVILACRNKQKAEEARDKIVKATKNDNVVIKIVDMASLDSVRAFAKDINSTEERLDVLVNNAGVGFLPDERTKDGLQLLMQVNYFSSFLLTVLLVELLKKSSPSRIVNVASAAGKLVRKLRVDKINEFAGLYVGYNNSKLCNILFTMELAKRLEGTGITTYSLHPGTIQTEFFRNGNWAIKMIVALVANHFFKTSEEGAQTTIYAAVAQGIEQFNGEHFRDCKRVDPYKSASVPGLPEKLWEETVRILKLKPEEVQF